MNKKYNIDSVKMLCQKIGCELLSTEYKSVKNKILLRCPSCGSIYERTWDNLKNRKNPLCNSCGMRGANRNKMPLYQEVKRIIEKDGNQLLDSKYWNCDTKLTIKCKCGNIFYRSYYCYLKSNRTCGCDRQSNGSKLIEQMLQASKVDYIKEYGFSDLPGKRFDFAVFKNNQLYCLIEFDGWFHYYDHGKWHQLERQ